MQSAIYTNNRAASLIENDCFERAFELLNQALSSVQDQVEKEQEVILRSKPANNFLSTSNKKRKDLEKSHMYSQPVYLNQTSEVQGHRFLSLVIRFNLALCRHLVALHGGPEDRDENLSQALELYESTVILQQESFLPKEATFFMTMNNLAHIHQMLHRPRQAQEFLNKMLCSLVAMMDNGEEDNLDQFDKFLDNASRTILPSINAAIVA